MTLQESQRSFDGYLFGGHGDPLQLESEEGLRDLLVRSGTRAQPQGDGSIPGRHDQDSRTITVQGWVAADRAADAEALMSGLRTASQRRVETPVQYRFRAPGDVDRFVWARCIFRSEPRSVDSERHGLFLVTLQFEVADPRVYSVELFSELIPEFVEDLDGWNWPVDWPLNTEAPVQQFGVVEHLGSDVAWPTFLFQYPPGESGDCDGVTVTNLTTGVELDLALEDLLTEGQTLTADMSRMKSPRPGDSVAPVNLAGANRMPAWQHPREALGLVPGQNVLRFDVDGNAPIVCRVQWRTTD